jgi:hypothetical protein
LRERGTRERGARERGTREKGYGGSFHKTTLLDESQQPREERELAV